MAMRASFSGRIHWSLVNIGIKALPIIADKEPQTHFLHRDCVSPIEERRFCRACGRQVISKDANGKTTTQLARGIETEKGWILLEPEDIQKILPEHDENRLIRIQGVIDPVRISELWYDKPYFLIPADLSDERAYSIFSRALREEKAVAIATYVSYQRQRLGVIYSHNGSLLLRQLLYSESIRSLADYGITSQPVDIPAKDIQSGRLLVRGMRMEFNYQELHDPTAARLKELVEAKAAQKPLPVSIVAEAETSPKVIDLRESLEKSIQAVMARQKKKPTVAAKAERKRGRR